MLVLPILSQLQLLLHLITYIYTCVCTHHAYICISDSFAIFHVLKSSNTPLFAVVTGTRSSSSGISFLFTFATFVKISRALSFFPLTRSHLTDSGTNLRLKMSFMRSLFFSGNPLYVNVC